MQLTKNKYFWAFLGEQKLPSSCKTHICDFLGYHLFSHHATNQYRSTYCHGFIWLLWSYGSKKIPVGLFLVEKYSSSCFLKCIKVTKNKTSPYIKGKVKQQKCLELVNKLSKWMIFFHFTFILPHTNTFLAALSSSRSLVVGPSVRRSVRPSVRRWCLWKSDLWSINR